MSNDLSAEKARIFRITHVQNIRWIFANGLHCANAGVIDPNFVAIGNPELIDRRRHRALPPPHQGVLGDYVPFYFTPFSPMMYNIRTGWAGITKRPNEDIAILVSSISRLCDLHVPFVFSDRHAYLGWADFFTDPADLDKIDWALLRSRNFKRDPDNPERFERYEAEALARSHVPIDAILGVGCYNAAAKARIDADLAATGAQVDVRIVPHWYFS